MWLRKERAGSDSYGHVWPEDGSAVEVTQEEAVSLLAIADGGYSIAEAPAAEVEEPGPAAEVTEPAAAGDVSEHPRPRRRRSGKSDAGDSGEEDGSEDKSQ